MVAAEMRPQDMDPNFQGEANGAYNFPVSGEATTWGEGECPGTEYEDAPWKGDGKAQALSQYNPTPGSGRVGYINIPPNNYPFYSEDEKYKPVIQADGGQCSDWRPMYNPTPEEADRDRQIAYETGVPHGYIPPGNKYAGDETFRILVRSELHTAAEYGENVDENGRHSGGPFLMEVSPKMSIEDFMIAVRDKCGIIPGIMKLSYRGQHMEDAQRTLEQYGVRYWNAKFPDWPITIRRY